LLICACELIPVMIKDKKSNGFFIVYSFLK
jgi:hypothetical protein